MKANALLREITVAVRLIVAYIALAGGIPEIPAKRFERSFPNKETPAAAAENAKKLCGENPCVPFKRQKRQKSLLETTPVLLLIKQGWYFCARFRNNRTVHCGNKKYVLSREIKLKSTRGSPWYALRTQSIISL